MTQHEERAAPASAGRPPHDVLLGGEPQEHNLKPRQPQRSSRDPAPLWRASSTGETARAAALAGSARAPTLRQRVLAIIEEGPALPECIFARLTRDGVRTVLTSVRPRCSELVRMGLIADSGKRAKGEGGCKAIIWRATTEEERAAFRMRAVAPAGGGGQ